MRFKRLVISIIALIFVLSTFSSDRFLVNASNGIVQQICGTQAALANNTNFQISTPLTTTAGNKLFAVANLQGSGNTVITGINVTDTKNAGTYSLRIRSVDQANTLYVGIHNHTVTTPGSTLFSAKFTEKTGGNQNLQFCVYELSSFISNFTVHTANGGTMPISTQAVSSSFLVLAGGVYNSAPIGIGHIMFYNGTDDVAGISNFSDIGHSLGGGSFSGGAVIAFVEEADIAFPVTTTLMLTVTVTAWNTIDPGTPANWIVLALFLFLIPAIVWGFLIGFHARPSATVFSTLIACFIGSILGTISGIDLGVNAVVPLGISIFNGISLGIYIVVSRQRGTGGN